MGLHRFASLLVLMAGIMGWGSTASAQVTHNSVTLTWTTPGDDGMIGNAAQFDLRYATSPINANNFASATRWTSMPTPASPGTQQNVTVSGLQANTLYYFAIKTGDDVPNWSPVSNIVSRTTLAAPDVTRPGPVASLAVTSMTDSTATLGWTAVGDDSLTGTATKYDIRYSTSPITSVNWASAVQVTGEPAPTAPGTSQSYTVAGLSRQVTYYFALKVEDDAGNVSALSNVVNATTPDTKAPSAIIDLGVSLVAGSGPAAAARAVEPGEGARP
jgi:phosphodiesterase/alkaline phosphatase D-like protein